jgi:hypothetical protein
MRASSAASITVVTGIPRSGTSLLMQMLAAGGLPVLGDGVRAPDADNPRGYFEFEPAKRLASDASWLIRAEGRAVKIVHTLVPSLPPNRRYRVLLVRRRLDEVLASQRAMLARRGEPSDPEGEARLLPALRAQLARLERWLEAREGLGWLRIDHAGLIADPKAAARSIAAFLDGGLDDAAMAACVDPALHRQRGSAAT